MLTADEIHALNDELLRLNHEWTKTGKKEVEEIYFKRVTNVMDHFIIYYCMKKGLSFTKEKKEDILQDCLLSFIIWTKNGNKVRKNHLTVLRFMVFSRLFNRASKVNILDSRHEALMSIDELEVKDDEAEQVYYLR